MTQMFDTVLVANRGEIAVRVIRTLHRLGVRSVAVFSEADRDAPHVALADEAMLIGPADARESYLSIERVMEAVRASGAQAVHPGYGFLSENPAFAEACEEAGVAFIGPTSDCIRLMGDKRAAKDAAAGLGVPVVPGFHATDSSDSALIDAAEAVGFPLIVKPSAGGGGMGMHVVSDREALAEALLAARREAMAAFGDSGLLLERYVSSARHIEVQVVGDGQGAVLHVGDRDCSVQRRHQKVIEEAPAPFLPDTVRDALHEHALALARHVRYRGVGTVEFVVDAVDPAQHFFLEMNTRLQVEHPVTEMVTGLDLVELQLAVAAHGALPLTQADVVVHGHAVEARVYAEDGHHDFLPSSGRIERYREPTGVRVDSGVVTGSVVSTSYDPLLLKVIAGGQSRDEAVHALDGALGATVVHGVAHNIGALRTLLHDRNWREGRFSTSLIADLGVGSPTPPPADVVRMAALVLVAEQQRAAESSLWGAVPGWRVGRSAAVVVRLEDENGEVREVRVRGAVASCTVTVDDGPELVASLLMADDGASCSFACDGVVHQCIATVDHQMQGRRVIVGVGGDAWVFHRLRRMPARGASQTGRGSDSVIRTPMPGAVVLVHHAVGDDVAEGDVVAVVEAMKMEYPLMAPVGGMISSLQVEVGQQVTRNQVIAIIKPKGA